MKKTWILIVLMIAVLVSAGLTGCQKKKDVTETKAVETKKEEADSAKEEAKPVEKTAEETTTAKPKDHPAH